MPSENKGKPSLRILAMRFSAIGDVAMTIPVLYSLVRKYPQYNITFLSNGRFAPLFRTMPENFRFVGVDLKHRYKGIRGLNILFRELHAEEFDMVADLHGVLRTSYLSMRFRIAGYRVAAIRKYRLSRFLLTTGKHNGLKPVRDPFSRYRDVFHRLGIDFGMDFRNLVPDTGLYRCDLNAVTEIAGIKSGYWIGIAPFATFKGKIYPAELMEKVIDILNSRGDCRLFIFAYGKEKETVSGWMSSYRSVVPINGQLDMWQELMLMKNLDAMISMDSANMHLASLAGVRVISVWGATHPAAGFLGYGQSASDCVQADIPCRPCSIYGKKECRYGDYRCMTSIPPESIVARLHLD